MRSHSSSIGTGTGKFGSARRTRLTSASGELASARSILLIGIGAAPLVLEPPQQAAMYRDHSTGVPHPRPQGRRLSLRARTLGRRRSARPQPGRGAGYAASVIGKRRQRPERPDWAQSGQAAFSLQAL